MYRAIVRSQIRRKFDQLSDGAYAKALRAMSPNVHHVFPGRSPLGGERHTREAVGLWFERLDRLFPGHVFDVERVIVGGWPWSTWIAVRWTVALKTASGDEYRNAGAHWLHLRWGRVDAFHAYLDTELVEGACRQMVAAGIAEAGAEPIS